MKTTIRGVLALATSLTLIGCATTGSQPTPTDTSTSTEAVHNLCLEGEMQSPIDLGTAQTRALMPVSVHYQEAHILPTFDQPRLVMQVRDGGHISLYGKRYTLDAIHTTVPAEHTHRQRREAGEMQFLHRSSDGEIAVVALPLSEGEDNPLLAAAQAVNSESDAIRIDLAQLLSGEYGYYAYTGSLSMPPCTEGVRWVVLQQASSLSEAQKEWLAEQFPIATRPTQDVGSRGVFVSQ